MNGEDTQKAMNYLNSIKSTAQVVERAINAGDWDEAMDCCEDIQGDSKKLYDILEEEAE